MADKGATLHVSDPSKIRNVVLVGPSGSGKTSLIEQLLTSVGVISRPGSVAEGNTVSDFDEIEIRSGRSIGLSLAPFVVDGIKVNVIDTPGYPDFVGDVRAGLRAADAALFVISAADGVDTATTALWDECAAVGMPRAILVTNLDNERTDFNELVAICQRVFGEAVHPLYLPLLGDGEDIAGVISLMDEVVCDYSSGARSTRPADAEHLPLIATTRNELLEAVITESEDETLMDRFLAGEVIDHDYLLADLEKAVARGHFHPILPASLRSNVGMYELIELIVRGFPSPLEHAQPAVTTPDGDPVAPMSCDPDGPLCAEVVKTSTDPYVGRISIVRVFSGTLTPETVLHVSGHFMSDRGHDDHDIDERAGTVSSPLGKAHVSMPNGIAGDIVAVTKLTHAETGDTLSSKDHPLLVEPWVMPEPLLPVAIHAHSKSDEDKLGQALARIIAEDPTLRLERNADTHQLVMWCLGEAHADVVVERLKDKYGVSVDSTEMKVSLRETFAEPAEGEGRLVKQSGGHGQYAICKILVEPLPSGAGFEFVDKVVGGAVPRQYIGSVEKGIRQQMERGIAHDYPLVDIRVTLIDGKAHSVDSSDMAFQNAGALALKDAASKTTITMLEPVADVSVIVDDEFVGAIMSDMSGRRAHVAGSEPVGHGRTRIEAAVPELELSRYAIDLRALAHGTGSFTRRYAGHIPMPSNVAKRLLST